VEVSSLREVIIHTLPHELRTPLQGILGYASLILEDQEHLPQDEIIALTERIFHSAVRFNRLIENCLLYFQLELKLRDPQPELNQVCTYNPSILIESTAIDRAQNAQRYEDLSIDVKDSIIIIEEDSLIKIVYELVDNAFKFSKAGQRVELVAEQMGDVYIMRITDYGRGLTPEQLAGIGAYVQFERKFYEQQGTGLGLVLAQRLSQLYGGSLHIESELGQGTMVTVTLRTCPQ
jgi:signal transduction histidine kinase